MIKFLHTADWHLGMHANFLPEEARVRFAQDRFDAVRRIATLARERECQFVLVAGDVFDSNLIDRQAVERAIEALSAFTVPVFLLPGNHDPLDAASIYRSAAWTPRLPAHVIVADAASAIAVPGVPAAEVLAAPRRTKLQLGDPLAACYEAPPSSAVLRILLGHGMIDELAPEADNPALISGASLRAALGEGRMHYAALGDRHSVTEISDTSGRAFYAGTPLTTDYGEVEPNMALIVSVDSASCQVERIRTGAWRFEHLSRVLTSEADVEELNRLLGGMPSKEVTAVKLALKGTLSLAAHARLRDALERHRLTFASLNTWERHTDLATAPSEADLDALQISGYARDALDALRHQADGNEEPSQTARDALNLLYRLAR